MSFIKQDYIFIHIPKTGGVSIKNTLNGAMQSGHETLYEIKTVGKDFFGTKYFPTQRVITCCRDPLTRFVSAFYYCQVMHKNQISLPKTIHQLIEEFPYRTDVKGWVHFRPMIEFIWSPKSVKVELIRFENFDEDFYSIFGQKIGKNNETNYKSPKFTTTEKDIIKDAYNQDYKYFKYGDYQI